MAKAGYCSTCGENVYLTPEGGCSKGHGAECVSDAYDVPDESTAPTADEPAAATPDTPGSAAPDTAQTPAYAPVPAYTPPPAYAPPAYSATAVTASEPPKKKRTGLIIAVVTIVLLLLCGCVAGGIALLSASDSSTPTAKKADPEKAKTEVAWQLVKGMFIGDEESIKGAVPTDTVALVAPAFWTSLASNKPEGAKIISEKWDGAVLTVTAQTAESKGTMVFTPSKPEANAVEVVSTNEGKAPELAVVRLAEMGGKWRVISLESGEDRLPLDAEGLLQLIEQAGQ